MKPLKFEYKLTATYLLIGLLYIHFSDKFVEQFSFNTHTINYIQSVKGSAFIILTSLLLYLLVRNFVKSKEKSEQDLIISGEKHKALYNFAPLAYQSLDMNGNILDVNPKWLQLLGYERNEVVGKNIKEFMVDREDKIAETVFKEMIEKGNVSGVIWKMKRKDEKVIFVRYEGNIGYNLDGSPRQTYCTFNDITAEHQSKIELIESENRYKSLFYDNKSVMLLINPETSKIVDANNSALEFYGYTHDEITSLNVDDINTLPKEEIDIEMKKAFTQNHLHFHFIHKLKNGGKRNVEVYSGKVVLKNEVLLYSIIHDITKQVDAEKALVKAKEKAEESDMLKSSFLANLSHEIRTPMNGIIGFTDLLRNPDLNSENKNKYIDIVHSSSRYLLSIINDIVEVSQLETRQIEVNESSFGLDELMIEIYDSMSLNMKQGVKLEISLPQNIGFKPINTDQVKLKQVITNLINNSIKNTANGHIRFGYRTDNNIITFFVEDTGKGIDPKNHEAIFERFRQIIDKNDTALNGSGLGLSISKSYVELLGGKIWVESELNSGSKFLFTIPYKNQAGNTEHEPENTIKDLSKEKSISNILIAEDDDANFEYLNIILKKAGKKVVRALDGQEALEICMQNESIDLVFMDIKMPRLDGFSSAAQIKMFRPELKIIAQTAYAMKSDEARIMESDFDGYVSKPIQKDKVLRLI